MDSSRAQVFHSVQKENQTVINSAFFPGILFGSGGELYYLLKMTGINSDFQTGERFEM